MRKKAVMEALRVTHTDNRLWVLKKASSRTSTENLGVFCNAVGATDGELARLILDRAAQNGLRPKSDLIV